TRMLPAMAETLLSQVPGDLTTCRGWTKRVRRAEAGTARRIARDKIEQAVCRRFTIAPMTNDPLAALPIGRKVTVSKTVSESDVYLFAAITGDFSPNHTDEPYLRKTRYCRRLARGRCAAGY